MPRLKECYLEKASTFYKAKTGVGCDGIHAQVSLHFEKETRGNVVEFLEKWNKLEMAATSLHDDALLIPKNVTSERADCAFADGDTLVGSCEGV